MENGVNYAELEKLSDIGATDGNEPAPTSIFSSIAATFTVCTSTSVAVSIEITLITAQVSELVSLW